MTKTHHPQNRAERLLLKELNENKTKRANVKRKLVKERLKDEESRNELREVARGDFNPKDYP